MQVTAFILARAGSKGLPGKNIRPLKGKPLICWSIDAAKDCSGIDDVIVSTDGVDIADIARAAGARVMVRPDELANDVAMPKDAIRYHLKALKSEGRMPYITVLLQPTSPLRGSQDIQACLNEIINNGMDSSATFVKSPSSPYRAWIQDDEGHLCPFMTGFDPWQPRQALPETFALNGAVYAVKTDLLLSQSDHSFLPGKSAMVVMPEERSVDIDTLLDFIVAEAVHDSL